MSKAKVLHLDFETFSELDIKKVGAYRYARDPSTRVLFASYKLKNGKINRWDTSKKGKPPANLMKWLLDPTVIIKAYNANFERQILKSVMGIDLPIERFRCTMIHAFGLSFAGTLAQVCEELELPEHLHKDKRGKDLINRFSKPQPPSRKVRVWDHENDPEGWEEFGAYCDQDVISEQAIDDILSQWPLRQEEWDGWFLDQRINDRGIPIDLEFVHRAIEVAEIEKARLMAQMERITKLDNPNSGPQLMGWLEAEGFPLDNLQKATVGEALDGKIPKKRVRAVLELKAQLSKSSVSKYEALARATCPDGRLYGALQYMGAQRTARWAGRIFQPQNLPRPDNKFKGMDMVDMIMATGHPDDAMTLLSSAIRGAICAGRGKQLGVADLAGIEGRVLPWLCYDHKKLDQIEGGLDMYIVAAAGIYRIHYDAVDSDQRFVGKVAELALGYQGALGALNSMAKAYGLPEFDEADGVSIVRGWRAANKPIVNFWANCEEAARRAINNPGEEYTAGRISFFVEDDFLFCELPSGRCLSYYKPAILRGKITYMGLDTYTRKWGRQQIYGGKFAENFAQAVSRDILVHGMFLIEKAGFGLIGTVHDEDLTETKPLKKYHSDTLCKLMCDQPAWAKDLPLAAEGYISRRYKK